jgi:hypothetical protein
MFGPGSRYARQPIAVFVDAEGRPRAFVTLREVPAVRGARPEDPMHIVTGNDRLDRLTWQHLGDPELFWRVCDANGALHPDEMTSVIGRRLMVPLDPRAGNG